MEKKLLISAIFMMLIIIAPSFEAATDVTEDDETWKITVKGFIIDYSEPDENTVKFTIVFGMLKRENEDESKTGFCNGLADLKRDELDHFRLSLNNHFVSFIYTDTFSV